MSGCNKKDANAKNQIARRNTANAFKWACSVIQLAVNAWIARTRKTRCNVEWNKITI